MLAINPTSLDDSETISLKFEANAREWARILKAIEYMQRVDVTKSQWERMAEWDQSPLETFQLEMLQLIKRFEFAVQDILSLPEQSTEPCPRQCPENEEEKVSDILDAVDYVVTANPPHRNRWELAKSLKIDAQYASDIVKELIENGVLAIDTDNNLAQLDFHSKYMFIKFLTQDFTFSKDNARKMHVLLKKINRNYRKMDTIKKQDLQNLFNYLSKDDYVKVKNHIQVLIAERQSELKKAPEEYLGKTESGEIVDFLNRVYGPYLDGLSFGRKELAELDPKAHRALHSFEQRVRKVSLDELNLPTVSEKNDALVSGLTYRQMVASYSVLKTAKRNDYAPK